MSQGIAPLRPRILIFFAALLAVLLAVPQAQASFHLVDVSEVYTNAQGNVQFVELKALFDAQTQVQNARVVAYNADSTMIVLLKDFTAVYNWTANQNMLLATAAFQDTAGFAPDFVIPNNVFFPDGRIGFDRDPAVVGAVVIDGVAYGNYTGANTGYGSPAAALPSDGAFSLTRVILGTSGRNNATDWAVLGNTPTRTDGMTTRLHYPASAVDPSLDRGSIALAQSRPNPMRDDARIEFSLRRDADVTLRIYGPDGRLVWSVSEGRLGVGPHEILWDGRDAQGRPVAGGVYLYRLSADGESAARRLHVVR